MARYKNQKRNQMKKLITIISVILLAFLLIAMIVLNFLKVKNMERENAIFTGQFNSIKDILEYYGCKFIKMKESTEENFSVDIYTNFKYDLYDDDKSNENFYNDVINEIAKFLRYESFRLIDESREEKIEIQVICDGTQIETIIINGIEDYFIYMDSQINFGKYEEIPTTKIEIQADELNKCIENNWEASIDFGSREAIFQDYYIFLDEGIKTRKINKKIYNVIFTNNYNNPVVNGISVGEKTNNILKILGEPTFQNKKRTIIGYKSNDIYIFFEENQISVYRNSDEEYGKFIILMDDFLNKKYTFLEFMNELTYIWPDYDEYIYSSDNVFISYPNKGIDIKLNYDNTDGIILYNNVGLEQDEINQYLKHTEFIGNLQVDGVFEAEKRRFAEEGKMEQKCEEYHEKYEKEDNHNIGKVYDYYMNMTDNDSVLSVYFISNDEKYPNCELNDGIDTYIWLNDFYFIYSIKGKGIYYYNLQNQAKGVIATGEKAQYKIKSYENGVLKYDEDSSIMIQF